MTGPPEGPIVTIGEVEGFVARGGMIELRIDAVARRVQLIVNHDTVRRSGLVLSSRFLALRNVTVVDDVGRDVGGTE